MTRVVRCGNTQKHKKMPGNATKWGEFDNQNAREIPPKKKKNFESQKNLNKKIKSLPSTFSCNKAEVSLDEDFFDEDKYCLTGNLVNEQENSTIDENYSNISLFKNKEDGNKLLTNEEDGPRIKKENADKKHSFFDENVDKIDLNEVPIKHKKIKLENESCIVIQNDNMLEQADNHNDFVEEHVKNKRNKKKRNKKIDSESFFMIDRTMDTSLLNHISFENPNESSKMMQDIEMINSQDKTIEPDQSFQSINRSSKEQKGKKYSKLNSDSNQSLMNNESGKNSSHKVFVNWKEQHLKKLKQTREKLGLVQLPFNVENKLYKIKKNLKEKGFPSEKMKEILREERRKEELKFRKVFNPWKKCFGCRKPGHVLADCPKNTESFKQETGICFKCGSVEHTSYKCPQKIQGYPYATCFICKEHGHIAKECSQNKHGVYPKGGRCNLCGNVNHLKKDCPSLKKIKSEEDDITLPTLNENASIDAEVMIKEENKEKNKKKTKIVKF